MKSHLFIIFVIIDEIAFLRTVQSDDFFNMDIQEIRDEINNPDQASFYTQWFNRFVDDDTLDVDDTIFEEPDYWSKFQDQ